MVLGNLSLQHEWPNSVCSYEPEASWIQTHLRKSSEVQAGSKSTPREDRDYWWARVRKLTTEFVFCFEWFQLSNVDLWHESHIQLPDLVDSTRE